MYIRNWMTSPAITVPIDMPAPSALALMNRKGIRRVPVVDGDRLVGIVTKTDLLSIIGAGIPGRRGMNKLLVEVMKKNPVAIAPDDTVEAAARVMLRRKFSGLPVVEDGRVVGVITESDLFRAICRMFGVDGSGARMEFTAADDRDLVDAISRHLKRFEIHNLVTIPNLQRGGWDLVMRVRGRQALKAL
jgi:acetoin utilization protein AcuB